MTIQQVANHDCIMCVVARQPVCYKWESSFRPMASILNFLKVADSYERKARFFPAFIVILPIIAFVMSLNLRGEGWVMKLLVAGGAGSALVVALAQMASAAGNRFGDKFWKQRGGLPTVRWLRASDTTHSSQQKEQWFVAIKKLTGLDIPATVAIRPTEEDAIIADAIRQLRYQIRGKAAAKMVDKHNEEYGFARNLAGLRWPMLGSATLGIVGCAVAWHFEHGSVIGCILATCLLIYALVMFFWLPGYVERAGDRYSESLFSIPAFSPPPKPTKR